jgi:hypothetical protein
VLVGAEAEVFTLTASVGAGLEVGDALAVATGAGVGVNGGSFMAHQTTIKTAKNAPAIQGHEKVGKGFRADGVAGEGDLAVQV